MSVTDITLRPMSGYVISPFRGYDDGMVRWQPGGRERLQQAALELFAEQGFERTTVAEIAARAELTERTFFRQFADKREVLFAGQDTFDTGFVNGIAAAPDGIAPMQVVATAVVDAGAEFFPDERRPWSQARQRIIDSEASLRERELLKLAHLAERMRTALLARGVSDPSATLAAESGATVFRVTFAQWIAEGETRSFREIAAALLEQYRKLASV
jgi:AcrR family transcriptional regulator